MTKSPQHGPVSSDLITLPRPKARLAGSQVPFSITDNLLGYNYGGIAGGDSWMTASCTDYEVQAWQYACRLSVWAAGEGTSSRDATCATVQNAVCVRLPVNWWVQHLCIIPHLRFPG